MRLVCPCCGATLSIEAMLADGQAREAVAAALALPAPLGDRVLRYLGLFRPDQRALSWDRAAKLLNELSSAIKTATVERNGRTWSAPLPAWEAALDQMLGNRDTLRLPLRSHGYLFEVVAGLASKQEAVGERVKEKQLQRGDGRRSGGLAPASAALPAFDREATRKGAAAVRAALRGGQTDAGE